MRAAVPETTIDEHGNARANQSDVGRASPGNAVLNAVAHADLTKRSAKGEFGSCSRLGAATQMSAFGRADPSLTHAT
jgi:hypothetical protein